MRKIHIENLKGIRNLGFTVPESAGVYLLVGENGSGKTTILNCLDRICNPRAFVSGFSISQRTPNIDQYRDAAIQYETETTRVRFRRRTKKWMPTPKKGAAELLGQFGFSQSIFIKADSKRIDATSEEIAGGRLETADRVIKDALNTIFATDRYNGLRRLRISHGQGTRPTYVYVMGDRNSLYSEKRFSTGELAIIRLVESIQTVDDFALILVDEAEMALHPKIQIQLVKYLQSKVEEKQLTVFISTHSTTLIKMMDKDHLMLLEADPDGNMNVICPCYAAKAIGGVDYIDNSGFDVIFFVEDDMARAYLDAIIRRLRREEHGYETLAYAIFPVGGFYETA